MINRRNTDPATEIISIIHTEIARYVNAIPYADFGTVLSAPPKPLLIRIDGFSNPGGGGIADKGVGKDVLDFADGHFIINQSLILEKGDRIILLPISNGELYFVMAKIDKSEQTTGVVQHKDPDPVSVGTYASEDRTVRYPFLQSKTWATIYGKVGDVLRTLTHIGHYHPIPGPVTYTTNVVSSHAHDVIVTFPDSSTAVNPE
jgi:hypothetical protein